MGVVAWTWREKITLRWDFGVLAWGLFIVIGGWTLGVVAIGYTALLLAWRVPASPLPADLSYGVYIYGWPVAQLVVHLLGPMTPAALSLFSIVAVVPLAFASWHLFEAPALSAVRRRVRLAQS